MKIISKKKNKLLNLLPKILNNNRNIKTFRRIKGSITGLLFHELFIEIDGRRFPKIDLAVFTKEEYSKICKETTKILNRMSKEEKEEYVKNVEISTKIKARELKEKAGFIGCYYFPQKI